MQASPAQLTSITDFFFSFDFFFLSDLQVKVEKKKKSSFSSKLDMTFFRDFDYLV